MSVVSEPHDPPGLTIVTPDEALARAKPAPSAAAPAIDGLTDEEWEAFEQALADR